VSRLFGCSGGLLLWRRRLCEQAIRMQRWPTFERDLIARKAYGFFKALAKQSLRSIDEVRLLKRLSLKYRKYILPWQLAEDLQYREYAVDVQCAILAGISLEEVASRMGFSLEEVQLYCALYYDVVDRLSDTVYILNNAIFLNGESYNFIDDHNRDRFLSYMLGPEAVRLVRNRLNLNRAATRAEICDALRSSIEEFATLNYWARIHSNDPSVQQLYTKILASYDSAKATNSIPSNEKQLLDSLLSQLDFTNALRTKGSQPSSEATDLASKVFNNSTSS